MRRGVSPSTATIGARSTLQRLHNQRYAALLAQGAGHCYLTHLSGRAARGLLIKHRFVVQPEYEESSPTEEELLELQEQNFRLMQQQQQLEMEAAAQQEMAAQAQPVGLRERIGFVGAGQARMAYAHWLDEGSCS